MYGRVKDADRVQSSSYSWGPAQHILQQDFDSIVCSKEGGKIMEEGGGRRARVISIANGNWQLMALLSCGCKQREG